MRCDPLVVAGIAASVAGIAVIATVAIKIWSLYYSIDAISGVYEHVIRAAEVLRITSKNILRAFLVENWKDILYTLFGEKSVMKAVLCRCEYCFDTS